MKNIPNLLTIHRFIVLPILVLGAYFDNTLVRVLLLIVYIISAFTDFLDGYIARHFNLSTNFGRIFDPISDKVLVIITLLMVIIRDPEIAKYIFIPVTIILTREFLISGLREGLSTQKVVINVSVYGKYKTISQMVATGFLIAGNKIIPTLHLDFFGIILLWIATIISIISGLDYVLKHRKYL